MKRPLGWCVVALLSLTVAAQSQGKMGGGTEQAIAGLEQKWAVAAKASNSEAIAPLLADKFINTDSSGNVTGKAETLARAKASKWQANELSNVKVTAFGKTAIATGEWTGKGTDENGKRMDARERWTDTWMEMPGGKWQCVASQSTPLKL